MSPPARWADRRLPVLLALLAPVTDAAGRLRSKSAAGALNPTPKAPIGLTQGTFCPRSTWHANGMAGEDDELGVKG